MGTIVRLGLELQGFLRNVCVWTQKQERQDKGESQGCRYSTFKAMQRKKGFSHKNRKETLRTLEWEDCLFLSRWV